MCVGSFYWYIWPEHDMHCDVFCLNNFLPGSPIYLNMTCNACWNLCWQLIFTDTTKAWLAWLGNDDNKVRQWWQQSTGNDDNKVHFMHDTVKIFLSLKTNAHFEPEHHVTDPITWRAEIQEGTFYGPPSTKGSQSQACKWNQHTAKRWNQIYHGPY